MLIANKIPHMKVYRQRVFLPKDEKSKTHGHMILVNNQDYKKLSNLLDNRLFFNQSSYMSYYMDHMFRVKIHNKTYNNLLRNERTALYKDVQKQTGLRTFDTIQSVQGKNVIFDLHFYNRLFYTKAVMINQPIKRCQEFIEYYKNIINDNRFSSYKKSMFIDLDDWIANINDSRTINPIMVINYLLWKNVDMFKELGDIDIFFYTQSMMLRVNPKDCNKYSYREYRREMARMHRTLVVLEEDENEEVRERTNRLTNNIVKGVVRSFKFSGTSFGDDDEIQQMIIRQAEKALREKEVDDDDDENVTNNIVEKITSDEKFNKEIFVKLSEKTSGRSTFSTQRDMELREQQKTLKIDNMTLEDMQKYIEEDTTLEANDVSDKVVTINKNVTNIRYPELHKAYDQKLYKKDLANVFMDLNNKSVPMYIRNIEVTDSSDTFNYKETWKVEFEDANRVRHTIKIDVPKFIDGHYMYLNGNRKHILNQLFNKPVVKTGPDTCQICTNYNKVFIRREGKKISESMERLKKFILSPVGEKVSYKTGNVLSGNKHFKTTIGYDELSSSFSEITVNGTKFIFDQEEVHALILEKDLVIPEGHICVGLEKGKPVTIDPLSDKDIDDLIVSKLSEKGQKELSGVSTGKKFAVTSATIMSKKVPLIFLMGYFEGITTVLRKAKISHRFSDVKPILSDTEGVIRFRDCYLIYSKKPIQNTFLMNAFMSIETMAFDFVDFESKAVYLDIFENIYNKKGVAGAFNTYYDCMIDPITKEVLHELNYPTDLVSLMLFCNDLLSDNSFMKENNMNMYRIRSNEVVAAMLHKEISTAYGKYLNSQSKKTKVSVPQDALLKNLMMLQTVEDHSVLNPIYELDKARTITPKGYVGLNLDQAYTIDKRSYDPTMLGVLAMSTSPDYNVGKVRVMSMEPNVRNARGYIDINDDNLDELKDANLFSPAEMLTPLGASRDDTIRTAMASKQSKHIVPTREASPVLISNGAEQVVQHHLSDDFAVTAKMAGEVMERDDKLGLIVVKYEDGSTKAINVSNRIDKNGAGGFFLSNKLVSNLQKGDKFEKNDILATDDRFFSDDINGNRFNIGVFAKVACYSSYCTFEDSAPCTQKLASRLGSEIVMEKSIVLGKNVNIGKIVKKGSKIAVNETLIEFEESFEEDLMNNLLSSIGEEMQEEIKTLGKKAIKSKYNGIIEDVKIYADCEVDEMSESLSKVCKDYYASINKKKKLLNKYDDSNNTVKCGIIFNEPTGKVESKYGKIMGEDVNGGVLIKFYIKFPVNMGVGDKITHFGALKTIISEMVPEGQEPFSINRPDEEISTMFAANSLLKRMVPSLMLTMFGNKILVELKRELEKIAKS